MDRPSSVRVCAAVPAELGELPGVALGVGPVVAAAAAGAWLARERPAAVILIGTAGSYAGGPPVGSVVVGARLGLASTAGTLGLGYVPMAPGVLEADAALVAAAGLPAAAVLTVVAITTDPGLAGRHAAAWQVEHMETYAVAHACAVAGVPFVPLLGISNVVGPEAHAQWLAHRDAAQAATQAAARALLSRLAA